MATLGSGVLMLSATSEGFKKDLKAAEAAAGAFQKKVSAIPEVGEKVTSAFGRVDSVSRSLAELSGTGDIISKSMATAEIAISSLTSGMQLATKVATGMKAALLGTGIGLAIAGVGYLISELRSAGEEDRRRREELDAATRRFLESARPGITGGPTGRLESLGGGMFRRESTPFTATTGEVDVARRGTEVIEMTRRLDTTREALGRTSDEMRVLAEESRLVAARVEVGGRVFEAMRERVEALRETFDRSELSRRIGGIGEAITRMSVGRMTLGMDPEEAERFRFTLRRVETDIGGVRVATLESVSAFDMHRRRMDELHDARRRGAISAEAFARRAEDSARALRAEAEALARFDMMARRARESREALRFRDEGMALRESFRGSLDRMREGLRGPERLLRRGAIDADTYALAVGRIGEEFMRLGEVERFAPGAFMEGSAEAVSAINAARRNAVSSDPAVRLERAIDFMRRVEEESRDRLREIARAVGGIRRI